MEMVLQTAPTVQNGTGTKIKVVRRLHTATIYPDNNCTVTVVTFEPKEGGHRDIKGLITVARTNAGTGEVRGTDFHTP
ncbi:hypothetical protein PM082_009524 [Marasmius tenuissimus]|nr:hypothetical protein PM082_009524 [Marasmius tenuissimus]